MKFKKSIKSGPFRMTFSKSGISTSFGVKGARVSTGKRGTYVTIGGNGIYYRKKILDSNSNNTKSQTVKPTIIEDVALNKIETVTADQTTDKVFKDFILEIQAKIKRPMYSNIFLISWIVILSLFNISDAMKFLFFSLGIAGFFYLRMKDKKAKEIQVIYDFNDGMEDVYKRSMSKIENFKSTQKMWRIVASKNTSDYKKNAGANNLVNRVPITVDNKSSFVKSNVDIYRIKTGKEQIIFLPDRVLFIERKRVGALSYDEINTVESKTNFIESGKIPKDSNQVGTTWQYVNKNGNPDKRFKNNRKIPVMEYGQIEFTSCTGVNYFFMTSNTNSSKSLYDAMNN